MNLLKNRAVRAAVAVPLIAVGVSACGGESAEEKETRIEQDKAIAVVADVLRSVDRTDKIRKAIPYRDDDETYYNNGIQKPSVYITAVYLNEDENTLCSSFRASDAKGDSLLAVIYYLLIRHACRLRG